VCTEQKENGICVTPTPTPTPITAIPNENEVTNLKGTASFFINLLHTQYLMYFDKDFFENIFDPSLTKNKDCGLLEQLSGCKPAYILNINNNNLEIIYKGLQRYYYKDGLKPIDYTFTLSSYYLSDFDYKHNFFFSGFFHTNHSMNTGKTIDLSQLLRIVYFKIKKKEGYIYQDGDDLILSVNPRPDLYSYNNNQNKKYTDSVKVGFDKEIKFIYIFNFSENYFPESVKITVDYECGLFNKADSTSRELENIEFSDLTATENNGGEIILGCPNI